MNFLAKLGMISALLAVPAAANTVLSVTGNLNINDSSDVYYFQFQATGNLFLTVQSYGFGGSSNAPSFSGNPAGENFAGQTIAAGGFDTYLTLFTGLGPTATFLSSNDDMTLDGTCTAPGVAPAASVNGYCLDSRLDQFLTAGTYTLALTVFGNSSYAENNPIWTLGDGFIGLQTPDYYDNFTGTLRTSNFALDLSTNSDSQGTFVQIPSPEPAGWTLAGAGMTLMLVGLRVRKQAVKAPTR